MWQRLHIAVCYASLLWAADAAVIIEADGRFTVQAKPEALVNTPRKRAAPVLLQAKATLKRPEPAQVPSDSKGLSFLQEDSVTNGAKEAKATADEFLTEVLPMAAPNLPMPEVTAVTPLTPAPVSFQLLSVLILLLVALVLSAFYRRPSRDRVTQQAKRLPILLPSDLARLDGEAPALVRLEGRIVLDGKSVLTAPFSEKNCVFYSASVSHPRHDEIRQPPVAFSTQQTQFSLELEDAPDLRIQVTGDVSLFNMQTGQEEWQHAFTEAPKNWCSFVLNHLVSDASANHFKKCLDLGSDGVLLDFRESALLLGSHVSCVGQVVKDADGSWLLRPWHPSKRWSSTPLWSAFDSCLAGSVLISDNPDLHP